MSEQADDRTRRWGPESMWDFMFAFALIQACYPVANALSPGLVLQAGLLAAMLYWAWLNLAWASQGVWPRGTAMANGFFVIIILVGLMALMASGAFDAGHPGFGLIFAVVMTCRAALDYQIVRIDRALRSQVLRTLPWRALTIAGWLVGGFLSPDVRTLVWAAALVLDIAMPSTAYRVLGRRAGEGETDERDGFFVADRFAGFSLILLLAPIVLESAVEGRWPTRNGMTAWPIVAGFGLIFLMQSPVVAELVTPHQRSRNRRLEDLLGGLSLMIPLAGLLIAATGSVWAEKQLDRPEPMTTLAVIGGLFIVLAWLTVLKRLVFKRWPWPRLAGLALLLAILAAGSQAPAVTLGMAAALVLVGVWLWEIIAYVFFGADPDPTEDPPGRLGDAG